MSIFNLPDLGEGLPDAEIVRWYVKEGDTVQLDAPIVAMETAKAVVDVPAPISGTISKLFGAPGDIIATGAPLVEFVEEFSVKSHKRPDTGTVAGALQTSDTVISERTSSVAGNMQHAAKVTPAVRALAQRMQVDLKQITPTGPNNTITTKDVEQAAQHLASAGELTLLKGVRRAMAQAMQHYHAEIVPVTIMDDAILIDYDPATDISVKIMQAIVSACKVEPALNAWYDGHAIGRRLIKQLDLGIAIDSEDGLFVPVIRNVGSKDAKTLRSELDQIKQAVFDRSVKAEDMRGSSFVLSNFGKFAGRYAAPIVVPPSVAILGVGKLRDVVVPIDGKPGIAKALPLSLSFDHRACTGGEASRFLGAMLDALK
jgi:2-oxoisovalerate dehydrogenase E2 component (dihydrolipoyl transacylase)